MFGPEHIDILREQWGLIPEGETTPITSGTMSDNLLFKSGDRRYLLKVLRIRTYEQVSFDAAVLEYLERSDFPASRVIRTLQGEKVLMIGERPALLLTYIEGQTLKQVTAHNLEKTGELLGRFHVALNSFAEHVEREEWEPKDLERLLREESHVVAERPMDNAAEVVERIRGEFETLQFSEDLPTGLTFQDAREENIIVGDDGAHSLIDFDCMHRGVILHDVATPVIWMCFPGGTFDSMLLTAYLRGYMKERPLSELERQTFFDALRFRALREAFVWPWRWVYADRAVENNRRFMRVYDEILTNEGAIKDIVWKS